MDWTIEFDKAIEQYLPDLEVLQDEPMSRHTTFRIGGPAKRMAFPSSREQLVLLMSFAKNYGANPRPSPPAPPTWPPAAAPVPW